MAVYLVCYAAAFLAARAEAWFLSGASLLMAAGWLFFEDMQRTSLPVSFRGLFSLSFVGGQGLSCLKLSYLQVQWEGLTWVVLFLAHTVFWLVFELLTEKREEEREKGREQGREKGRPALSGSGSALPVLKSASSRRLLMGTGILTGISLAAFLLEARLLGFIPLFLRGVPHAYSYFHVSGLHYFTVACVLVPSFAVCWAVTAEEPSAAEKGFAFGCAAVSFLIPLLIVSRFYLVFSAVTAGLVFLFSSGKRPSVQSIAGAGIILLPLYVLLTAARSHSVDYLNGIFEMKARLPIFVSQPYIYIAHNYDNLNCLVRALPKYTFGLRMLYPVWALTGLKFLYPGLWAFPLYVTKTELTTVTLFYDAYYDFGTAGVVFLSALLGLVSYYAEHRLSGPHGPAETVIYAQLALYLGLSFFTTWFSNPATWFLFAVSGAIVLWARRARSK